MVGVVCDGCSVDVDTCLPEPARDGERDDVVGCGVVVVVCSENIGGVEMMDVRWDGRDVVVRLRDDVWQLEEAGTLSLTRRQAQVLRLHLNELNNQPSFEQEPENG